ncbi:hypothetical protein N9L81_05020 [Planktomarina temperata]|nr:hypothetical protein [Planktomarina temperata]
MNNLVAVFVISIFFPTLIFADTRTFSHGGKTYLINDLNQYCTPEDGTALSLTFEQFAEAAVANGNTPNLVHLAHCLRKINDGTLEQTPTMWIRVHQNKVWDKSISDADLQKLWLTIYKTQIGSKLPEGVLNKAEDFANKLRPEDMGIKLGEPFIVKNHDDYLSFGTLVEETINGRKIVHLTNATFKALNNDIFYIYVASPIHKDLLSQTELSNNLYFIAQSFKWAGNL